MFDHSDGASPIGDGPEREPREPAEDALPPWSEPGIDDPFRADDDPRLNELCAFEPDPLAEIARFGRAVAMFHGSQLATIAEFVNAAMADAEADARAYWNPQEAMASAEAEVALMLGVAASTAANWIDLALRLAERVPASLAALTDGIITLPKAKAILEETENLDLDDARRIEEALLPGAGQRTPGNLRRAARRAVMAMDADAATKRRQRARAERDVTFTTDSDGMAFLGARLPAEDAVSVFGVIDTLAHAARADGDERPIGALRADALVDLILNPGGQQRRVTHTVLVSVPATTLLGLGEQPAELHGYGPIPAQVAREIAGDATWAGLFADAAAITGATGSASMASTNRPPGPADPVTGPAVDPLAAPVASPATGCDCPHAVAVRTAANRYAPSAKLAAAVRDRDRHCRFPGCRQPARHADLDHTVSFRIGGRTTMINLAVLCRRHHRVKHLPGWDLHQAADGILTWTTPAGRTYRTDPPGPTEEPPDFPRD